MDPTVYCAPDGTPGQFLAHDAPAVPVGDRGLLVGFGLFETLRVAHGGLPLWYRHLARLHSGASFLGIDGASTITPDALLTIAKELLVRNSREDGVLRITLTAGTTVPTWMLSTRARVPSIPVKLHPVRSMQRGHGDATAAVKTTSRTFYELALREAAAVGADDGVILGEDGTVLETCFGNLLWLLAGQYFTPRPDGRLLPGIGCAVLCEGLAASGHAITPLQADLVQLRAADAIFVVNAVHGARPALLPGGPPAQENPTLQAIFAKALRG